MEFVQVEKYRFPADAWFDRKEHTYVLPQGGGRYRVGVDALAAEASGAVAQLRIMGTGMALERGWPFGWVEASAYTGPLKTPLAGRIVEVNERALSAPRLVNEDPYGEGWLVAIETGDGGGPADLAGLAHGEADVRAWAEAELRDYRARGWLSDPWCCGPPL